DPRLVHDLERRLLDRPRHLGVIELELRGQAEERLLPRRIDVPARGNLQVEGDLDGLARRDVRLLGPDRQDLDRGLLGAGPLRARKVLGLKAMEPREREQAERGEGSHDDYYSNTCRLSDILS